MNKRLLALIAALALCLGLCGCLETPEDPEADILTPAEPLLDMKTVSDGSFEATVIAKEDDGITLEMRNRDDMNKVSATFTAVKINGKEYTLNQSTYAESPVSITRTGYEGKTLNLTLPANDFARIKVASSDLHSASDYNNVDLTYSETHMDEHPVTKTGKTISIKNA